MKVELYDAKTIDSLIWPNNAHSSYTKNFVEPLIKNGIHHYVDNIQADMYALKIDEHVFPTIAVSENYDNSWVCSPYNHYISYGMQAIRKIVNPLQAKLVNMGLGVFGKICRACDINSVVYVNHGLFSTDIYPEEFTKEHIQLIVDALKERFPQHAIIFRSLNPIIYKSLMEAFKSLGFNFIATRLIFMTDTKNDSIFQTRIIKSDIRLWKNTPYEILDETQISSQEYSTVLDLYQSLYLMQHSFLNPQFNRNFLELMIKNKLLNFNILKINGIIKGVSGYFRRNGILHSPFFGYEKHDPDHTVIYRLLSIALLLEAKKDNSLFHQGAGAAFYKTVRRAETCQESMAVYTDHLAIKQKFVWQTCKFFINHAGPRYMKKY